MTSLQLNINLKDRRTVENKKYVIYQLKCNDYPVEYIGETGRNAGIRMNEHKRDITNKKISNNISNHHSFNTNEVGKLCHLKRKVIQESLLKLAIPNSIIIQLKVQKFDYVI